MFINVDQAMYDTVHDFKDPITGSRGVFAVCEKIHELTGISLEPGTLQHKVNPKMPSHKLTFHEAALIIRATNDARALHAMCHALGFVCIQADNITDVSDMEFLNYFTHSMALVGAFNKEINTAFVDGVITQDEVKSVAKSSIDAIAAIARVPVRMEGMTDG